MTANHLEIHEKSAFIQFFLSREAGFLMKYIVSNLINLLGVTRV